MNTIETMLVSSILGGTALIPFVDFVTQDIQSSRLTYLIALASSVLVGAFVAFATGHFIISTTDPTTWFVSSIAVLSISQTIFNLYWKNSLVRKHWLNPNLEIPSTQAGMLAEPGEVEQPPDVTK